MTDTTPLTAHEIAAIRSYWIGAGTMTEQDTSALLDTVTAIAAELRERDDRWIAAIVNYGGDPTGTALIVERAALAATPDPAPDAPETPEGRAIIAELVAARKVLDVIAAEDPLYEDGMGGLCCCYCFGDRRDDAGRFVHDADCVVLMARRLRATDTPRPPGPPQTP